MLMNYLYFSHQVGMHVVVCSRLFVCLTLSFPIYLDWVLKDVRDCTQRLPVKESERLEERE